ncbi:MAG: four helix bundle protein [Patescibacteria group bacterium]
MATGLENLKIYKMAADAEVEVHEITKLFPFDEKFRSVDQLRRSSNSTTNNIAEAYNKNSPKEKIHILNDIAKCEAEETKRNLIQCARKNFAEETKLLTLAEKYTEILKGVSGYIRFIKNNLPT